MKIYEEKNNVIDMSIGDLDISTSDEVISKAFSDAIKGYTHYSPFSGDNELINEIVLFYKEEYNIGLTDSEVFISMGATHALYLALSIILKEGDEVIIPTPHYQPYENAIKKCGGHIVFLETCQYDDFQISIDKFKELLSEKTKMVILNSPNNPTGTYYRKEIIEKIIKILKEKDIYIVLDNVYSDIIYNPSYCMLSYIKKNFLKTIIVDSFSKKFAMAGWRVGYLIADANLIRHTTELNESITSSASTLSQRAAIYALKNRSSITEAVKNISHTRVIYMLSLFKDFKKIDCYKPDGTYYLYLNISKTGVDSKELCFEMKEKHRILINPGRLGACYHKDFVRVSCNFDIEKLNIVYNRMNKSGIFN